MTKEEVIGKQLIIEITDKDGIKRNTILKDAAEYCMDQYYNIAIEDAIEEIHQWSLNGGDSNLYHYFNDELKPKLESLKKKP